MRVFHSMHVDGRLKRILSRSAYSIMLLKHLKFEK